MLLISLGYARDTQAQLRLHVNLNIGSQPDWGPSGYNYAEYYYLPDIETYYYVPTRQFIYLSGRNWVFSYSLPPMYRDYDVYRGYKIVINEDRPYLQHNIYRSRYFEYRDRHDQRFLRDERHEEYERHDNGNHYGQNK